jgi:hypothetical protein
MRRTFTALILLLVFSSCFKDGVLNLTNGLVFNINAKLLPTPITVSFVNALPGSDLLPDSIRLEIFGEDSGNLVTPAGSAHFVVIEGLVFIGVNDNPNPILGEPLNFGIQAEAPGFYPATYSASLPTRDIPQHISVYLIQEGATPPGVSDQRGAHQVSGAGFSAPHSLQTPLSGGKEEQVSAEFPAGAQLFTRENALVTGNVQMSLVHYDNRTPPSTRATAGITEFVDASSLNGTALGKVSFYQAGVYSLFIRSGQAQVDHFSKPLSVRMTLNSKTFNPETGQYIAEGDLLKVWRFDEKGKRWEEKGQAVVKKMAGKFLVDYPQSGAGTWMVGQAVAICQTGATLVVQSNIPAGACTRNFYTRLVDVNTGKALSNKWSDNYLSLENQKRIALHNLPEGVVAKLQVWEGVGACEGQLLAESQPFHPCGGGTIQVNLSSLNTQDWLPISISLSGYCTVKGEQVAINPNSSLMYRPAGCGVYGLVGELPGGEACMATLKKGQSYDFKTLIGNQVFEFTQIPMETGDYFQAMPNGDVARIRVDASLGAAKLIIEDLPMPSDICNLLE